MKKRNGFFARQGPGLVLLAGSASVALGAGMLCLPAGLITGGVLAIAWWVLDCLGRDADGGEDT